jgi:hypothetical protein
MLGFSFINQSFLEEYVGYQTDLPFDPKWCIYIMFIPLYRVHREAPVPVQVRKNLRLVKAGEHSECAPKQRLETPGEDLLWMTAPNSAAGIIEYTWTPGKPPKPAAQPKLRRRR